MPTPALKKLSEDFSQSIISAYTKRQRGVYGELAQLAKLANENLDLGTNMGLEFARANLEGIRTTCLEEAESLSGPLALPSKRRAREAFTAYAARAKELYDSITPRKPGPKP
jgi:hypothetical protein